MQRIAFSIIALIMSVHLTAEVVVAGPELPSKLYYFDANNNEVTGHYSNLFRLAANNSNTLLHLKILPWTRVLKTAQSTNNTLIFPVTRTPEREDQFKWIMTLSNDGLCFIGDKEINSLSQARKLNLIAVHRNTTHENYLRANGFTNLVLIENVASAYRVLSLDKKTAWFGLCSAHKDAPNTTLIKGKTITSEPLWLAAGMEYIATEESNSFINELKSLIKP